MPAVAIQPILYSNSLEAVLWPISPVTPTLIAEPMDLPEALFAKETMSTKTIGLIPVIIRGQSMQVAQIQLPGNYSKLALGVKHVLLGAVLLETLLAILI